MNRATVRLRVAHSPDADDAFMFYGIALGLVDLRGLLIEPVQEDIESLNARAVAGELEVTAISFGAWPRLAERYDLLSVGSSFGLGFGPRVVAKQSARLEDLRDAVVAIPGELTTAALVLRLMLPGVATRVVDFERIPEAVAAGEVDAGVVIHESQLTHEREGLALVEDMGRWWHAETGGLPLPLGGNAIRRDVPEDVVADLVSVLRESIGSALADRERAIAHALQYGRGLDSKLGDEYVAMYVNELTLDPGDAGRRAVDELYRRAAEAKLIEPIEPRWA